MTHWLHRREEAVVNARKLLARLRESRDPAEVLKAQQDWVTAAVHLLAADAAAYHSASLQLMDRARSLVQPGARTTEQVVPHVSAATCTTTKPYRLLAGAE